ncbi:MAG: glucosidase [Armatimonadetes bacterium]|nr:glucosidase [Armatimonadota bacterium]
MDEPWYRWGPYLSEREWGTVREDYSPYGTAWDYFPHDHARSRAYRWSEDGLLGYCDKRGMLCFSFALWNGKDHILKERLFGLTNSQGNHGEDVKECYYYQDATPSHSYLKATYLYPQAEFPYGQLEAENRDRSKELGEFELWHTQVFNANRYFEVTVEYAKFEPGDTAIRLTVHNAGPDEAALTLIPQVWMRKRNPWIPGALITPFTDRGDAFAVNHPLLGETALTWQDNPEHVFTDNETNDERLYGTPNPTPYVKDAFHEYIVNGKNVVNPSKTGTKAGLVYRWNLAPDETQVVRLRLKEGDAKPVDANDIDQLFATRTQEADEFYKNVAGDAPTEAAQLQRQAFAGLIWSKQYYHFDVARWLDGDPGEPPPPPERTQGRNKSWRHVRAAEVVSMPDKWEYPWFAAWDLGFQCIPFALIDAHFAKQQLLLLFREWYMHPNGAVPAFEWSFDDVNPPVHAWAAWRVYTIDRRLSGKADVDFLTRIFHKLLLTFTWWVNRKDSEGNNVFEGGFLGLDNIGVIDRNSHLINGQTIEQSDSTSWLAMYCLNMMNIALELAKHEQAYEDVASKFFEHFMFIADAMNNMADQFELWDETDGFYYDLLRGPTDTQRMRVHSMVGLLPMFATEVVEEDSFEHLPAFKARMEWFLKHRKDIVDHVACMDVPGMESRRLFSVVTRDKVERLIRRMLDETEFLSPYGLRALSKYHEAHPYTLDLDGEHHQVDYEPGESTTDVFGGNSNWRGPIWFPLNYLMIETLQKLDYYYGDSFKVEMPTGSGVTHTLAQVSLELERRLMSMFLTPASGAIPPSMIDNGPLGYGALFHEYFHADTGRGLGASHQTGWTALVAKIVQQLYNSGYSESEALFVEYGG